MRGTILIVMAMLIVGAALTGCSKAPAEPTLVANANTVTGDASAQLENQFDSSLPSDATSATSDLDTIDSDLTIQ